MQPLSYHPAGYQDPDSHEVLPWGGPALVRGRSDQEKIEGGRSRKLSWKGQKWWEEGIIGRNPVQVKLRRKD